MKKLKIIVIMLLLISMAVSFSSVTVSAATISSGSTYSSLDGTSGRLVINSVDSFISGSSWNVTVSFTVNMVNSWLYTGGNEYYRFFIAEINGVTGPAMRIKDNTESWYSGTSHSFSYNLIFPVDPNNNVVSARFRVMDANSNTGDTATFDTGYGNTVILQPVQKATDLSLNVSSKTLYTDNTFTIVPMVSPSNTYNKAVNYSTSDASIASVSSGGIVNAMRAGNAVITVTTADGSNISRTVNVTVLQYVTGITVNDASPTLYTGNIFRLIPQVAPIDATDKTVSFASDNTAVATVNASGMITAVKAGTARVTVTALDRSTVKCTATVTVLQKAASVVINKSLTTLYTGMPYTLRCTVLPSDTTDKSVTYASSDTNVLTIDATGLVMAKKVGTAVITVTTADGSNVSDSVTFTVCQHVTDIVINDTPPILYTGDTFRLTATVLPDDASNKTLSYTSSDAAVASVDTDGLITALKAGNAAITIAATDGSWINKTVTVTVRQRAASLTIDNPIDILYNGQMHQLNCTVLPEDTTDKSVTYSSSDISVAAIDESGLITLAGRGRTTITVTTNDGSAISKSFELEVKQYVESITSDKKELTLYTGEKETLNITVLPENANNKELDFSSSDTSIAAVNANGKITAVKAGTAVITIAAKDGSGCFDTVNITVKQYAEKITVTQNEAELTVDDTYQITASVLPEDTTDKRLTYSSGDESILTVDENGLVTAHAPGKAKVTVTAADRGAVKTEVSFTLKRLMTDIVISENTPKEVYTGREITIRCEILPSDASEKTLIFVSSDESIAMVDKNGVIRGIAAGSVIVTVKSNDGTNIERQVAIDVRQSIIAISFEPDTIILNEDETFKITAVILPQNAYNTKLDYRSSNPSVVETEAGGIIRGVKKGTAVITAEATDGSGAQASFTVTVRRPVTSVKFKDETVNLITGESMKLSFFVSPNDASNKAVGFTSSDSSIVQVDDNGKITAIKESGGIITVFSIENPEIKDMCRVIVQPEITPVTPDKPITENIPTLPSENGIKPPKADNETADPPLVSDENDGKETGTEDTFIDRETVKWIVIVLGIVSLILLIIFRKQLLLPIFKDDDDDENEEKENK